MTGIVFWLCDEGHFGAASVLPKQCCGTINGRPCEARVVEATPAGHPKRERVTR